MKQTCSILPSISISFVSSVVDKTELAEYRPIYNVYDQRYPTTTCNSTYSIWFVVFFLCMKHIINIVVAFIYLAIYTLCIHIIPGIISKLTSIVNVHII